MDTQTLVLLIIVLALAAYAMTLYHMAHGGERKAVEVGAKIVLDAMRRDGRIMAEGEINEKVRSANIGEVEDEPEDAEGLPDIIVARNKKHAEQIGDSLSAGLMKDMDKLI